MMAESVAKEALDLLQSSKNFVLEQAPDVV